MFSNCFFSLIPLFIILLFLKIKCYKIENKIEIVFFGIISVFMSLVIINVIHVIFPLFNVNLGSVNTYSKSYQLTYFIIIAGFPEELSKYISVKFLNPKTKDQIIVDCILGSLVFCFVEDLFYMRDMSVLGSFRRAIIPMHLCFQGIMALFMIKSFELKKNKKILMSFFTNVLMLIILIFAHGFFNFFANIIQENILFVIMFMFISYFVPIYLILNGNRNYDVEK